MRNHPVNALLQITGIGLLNAKLLNHRWVRAWVSQLPEDIAILLGRRLLAEPQDSQLLHLQILGLLLFRPRPCPITGCSFVCITTLGFAWTYLGVHQFSFFCYGTSPHNPTSPRTSFCLSGVGSCCCNIRPSSLPASRHVLLYERIAWGFCMLRLLSSRKQRLQAAMWQWQQQWLQIALDCVSGPARMQMAGCSAASCLPNRARWPAWFLFVYGTLGTSHIATSTNNPSQVPETWLGSGWNLQIGVCVWKSSLGKSGVMAYYIL